MEKKYLKTDGYIPIIKKDSVLVPANFYLMRAVRGKKDKKLTKYAPSTYHQTTRYRVGEFYKPIAGLFIHTNEQE